MVLPGGGEFGALKEFTSSGLEPAGFLLAAWRLGYLRYRVPPELKLNCAPCFCHTWPSMVNGLFAKIAALYCFMS
jgi:hypothetical protein